LGRATDTIPPAIPGDGLISMKDQSPLDVGVIPPPPPSAARSHPFDFPE